MTIIKERHGGTNRIGLKETHGNPRSEVLEDDHFHDECGVFGIYNPGATGNARAVYFGLHTLQHRGQESAGIAANRQGHITYYKNKGLVQEVFSDEILEKLQGDICIGHVRYSTTGGSFAQNAQPLVVSLKDGDLALAHNGNLTNTKKLRNDLQNDGVIFQTTLDTEVLAALIAKSLKNNTVEEAITKAAIIAEGAFSLVITIGNKLIGLRDPNGIRPLCFGKSQHGYIFSSESCVFPMQGATMIRDVEPGEMVVIENGMVKNYKYATGRKMAACSFEYVYFARPDSKLDKSSIYHARHEAGKWLAKEHPVEADLVISVPDSGTVAAIGYAEESGIPYGVGLLKNRYVGRTFLQPNQEMREQSIKMKLSVLAENVRGKRIVMVDDSVVRGTTSGKIIKLLKDAGATEVHVRICSPPVTYPCRMGIATPDREKLVAANQSIEEIRAMMRADSLGYLSEEGLCKSIGLGAGNICRACFNGDYPINLTDFRNEEETK